MRSPTALSIAASLLAVCAALAASAPGAGAADCSSSPPRQTIAYEAIAGVPANSTSLDIYAPAPDCLAGGAGAPVVVWVHGGAYQSGDKGNQVADKVRLFSVLGWIFVSVNYRLTVPGDPNSARYPDHFRDVAAAVAWLREHIDTVGGDAKRLALLGHSAGADIVSNVSVDPQWLVERSLDLGALRCAAPLDTEGFDKVKASPGVQAQWVDSLGNNPNYKTETSASYLVKPGIGIPPTITVVRGGAARQKIESAFAQKLRDAGVPATVIDARSLSHSEVNTRIGEVGDTVMTPPLLNFLRGCFSAPKAPRATLRKRPPRLLRSAVRRPKVTFVFGSKTDGARFQCRLGPQAFSSCRSPRSYRVDAGSHAFSVRAVVAGKPGPATTFRFRVVWVAPGR